MPTTVIGAGIIGVATAYYLSQSSKDEIHLVEASPQLFASASGNAAGFLARDVSHKIRLFPYFHAPVQSQKIPFACSLR